MSPLILLLALPPAPVAHEIGPQDCFTQDLHEGAPVTLDCDGLVLGRAQALMAIEATQDAHALRESWPVPAATPWYDRPTVARIEGGLVVGAIFALAVVGLESR